VLKNKFNALNAKYFGKQPISLGVIRLLMERKDYKVQFPSYSI